MPSRKAWFMSGVLVLAALSPLAMAAKPSGGNFPTIRHTLYDVEDEGEGEGEATKVKDTSHVFNFSCKNTFFYEGAKVYLKGHKKLEEFTSEHASASVMIRVSIVMATCFSDFQCSPSASGYGSTFKEVYSKTMNISVHDHNEVISFPMLPSSTKKRETTSPPATTSSTNITDQQNTNTENINGTADSNDENKSGKTHAETGKGPTTDSPNETSTSSGTKTHSDETEKTDGSKSGSKSKPKAGSSGKQNSTSSLPSNAKDQYSIYKSNVSGLFVVSIESILLNIHKAEKVDLTFTLEMKNYYGYLSAIDYPALVFYGLMTSIYAIMGVIWSIAMCCSYKDLVRLQFWIFAVIILGFLEKTFFVSEYSSINLGEDSSFLNFLAEVVSAMKRALARVLIIIVSLGFGTVRPRLGDSTIKVVAVGVIYFILAAADGIVRAKSAVMEVNKPAPVITLFFLLIMDFVIFYWVFTSLVSIRRALRLRKNYVKLSMYNHFAYTLVFAIIAAIVFIVWTFVAMSLPRSSCLEDWKELWLRDCIWHVLFCVILIVIMIIWRPSSNTNRFAYSLVNELDEDDEQEQVENKNFESVKMRSVGKSDTVPPPVSSQAEDDLRWVEENLPTTVMDKALPLIMDSDEEMMSTKFEASKLN